VSASATRSGWTALHATALVVGESGVLLRGPSGAGKSSLALALIWTARERACFAALVADDRVVLRAFGDRLIARGAPEFAGRIERRFEGLITVAAEPAAVIRLVVDLAGRGAAPPRLPDEDELSAEILGVRLPRVPLDPAHGPVDLARGVLESLARRV
jgi:serine kinase of HPr protein (carbohydrate metabolism regulator)